MNPAESVWALVERYADSVCDYNTAVRIDVGINKAGAECLAIEKELRDALRPPTPAADQQTERAAFERTIRSLMVSERNPCEREVDSDGDSIYSNEFVRIAWVGWCCRAPLDACFAGGSPAKDVEAPAAINQDVIDAKRYRWLRDAILDSENPIDGKLFEAIHANPTDLDEALDAVMLAAAPTGADT